ncbi:hypothetical protein BDY19DRAFT_990926 [Irpex rosettiformis]|uniref:Uncharacterized protein n=1 Tax=Irpex rosettiformis TaxID=378272 RepID=A0ACB8UCY9_9APHY|nr:hypothetical protein BDY19DRAFT_990926 [Irpex rosettiformis]
MSDPSQPGSSTAPPQNVADSHVDTPETPQPQPSPPPAVTQPTDRSQLLQTAQTFLNSSQIRHESNEAKQNFLVQKGLTSAEIGQLLQTVPAQAPLVPPRTYPQLPPSNLPNLLSGLLRIATWIAGGSVAILLTYFRFIYPRIAKSFEARHAIRTHQRDLLKKLTTSIEATKSEQASTFALLPTPEPRKEDPMYAEYKSLEDILVSAKDPTYVPDVTVLRCAIADLEAGKRQATATAILQLLEEKMPWSGSSEAEEVESRLWQTLSSNSLFSSSESTSDDEVVWKYGLPPPPPPPPLLASLSSLEEALPPPSKMSRTKYQNTLQTLTDLTGYITTQTYSLGLANVKYTATGVVNNLSSEEEEIRREIRGLKGLVLNRRSFLPARPPSVSLGSSAA